MEDDKMPNVICAWCKTPLRYDEEIPAGKISHGICHECSQKYYGDRTTDLKSENDKDEVTFPLDPRVSKISQSTQQVTKPFLSGSEYAV